MPNAATERYVTTHDLNLWGNGATAIGNGAVWIYHGKIISIHVTTKYQYDLAKRAKDKESAMLYPTARHYDKIAYECTTKLHHIRIQETVLDGVYPDKFQYFSWKKSQSLSERPELALTGKSDNSQYGQTGGTDFIFKQAKYTYLVSAPAPGFGDSYPTVKNHHKVLSNERCYPRNIDFN